MKKFIFFIIVFWIFLPGLVSADSLDEKRTFFIEPSYDLSERSSVNAILRKITQRAYFYVDENWWNSAKQNEAYAALSSLGNEFDNKIYPVLIDNFGSEWNPGIDKDVRITILIHPMAEGAGGYFRSNDEYLKIQVPGSNEREMVYLSSAVLSKTNAQSFLAHEFTHLITFNQKNKIRNIDEETWLTEMRAEYAPTLLGYDDVFFGSYLQNRVQILSNEPFNAITEWKGTESDYGVVNLFAQYLVDHYGKGILIESLHSPSNGIDSINYALNKNGITRDFSQIFIDWTIAAFINDCNFNGIYCYKNANLGSLHVYPRINFLPLSGQSVLSVTDTTKDWAGNWFKIIGGKGSIKVSFVSNGEFPFIIPYIIQKSDGSYVINFLDLIESKGEINISNFGTENIALIIVPVTQVKTADFSDNEPTRSFTFTVSASGMNNPPPDSSEKIIPINFSFKNNLSFGIRSQDAVYLKIILAKEGCVSNLANTNYFGLQTLAAVKCFQNKYRTQVSIAAGYNIAATGFVGPGTRAQLNLLLTN
ncbi:MAG: hypothetical protein WC845_02120 [Candidatus Staskawiczbacteria bacterium]|jgi:hypothetical protein